MLLINLCISFLVYFIVFVIVVERMASELSFSELSAFEHCFPKLAFGKTPETETRKRRSTPYWDRWESHPSMGAMQQLPYPIELKHMLPYC